MPARIANADTSGQLEQAPEPALQNLLDHIAAELAAEFVRLMEAAADEEQAEKR